MLTSVTGERFYSSEAMELLIDNRTISEARTASHNIRRDMPRTIAALPPRLRMKILFRSEEQLSEFEPTDSNVELCKNEGKGAYPSASEEIFVGTDCPAGSDPPGVRGLHHSHRSEEVPPKITLWKFNSDNEAQRRVLPGVLPLQNDLGLGEAADSIVVDNLLPAWFERALEACRHNCSGLENLPKLNREMWQITEAQDYLHFWRRLRKIRQGIQEIFKSLLENNLKFCCKENVEAYFWKVLYYNAIEYFKQCLKGVPLSGTEIIKDRSLELISDGADFYEGLIEVLKAKYSLSLKTPAKIKTENKAELLVKVSAQKIFLSLGDLARYEEQISGRGDFSKAKQHYHTARSLVPTNGIPYNQLAILAIYSKRQFDAIYYHMRSLTASNPIHSARESLKVLFDEIRKKFESQAETKVLEQQESAENPCFKLAPIRKEIWIHPDGSRRLFRITPYASKQLYYLDERALKALSSDDLFKRFQLSYLCVIGKLFTKIGMENFRRILFQMLSEFQEAIERDSFLYGKHRLLQIITLNIFAIECNAGSEFEHEKGARTEVRNHAFNVSSLMFGIILNRANELLTTFVSTREVGDSHLSSEQVVSQLPANLRVLLQAVKIWCDWLSFNLHSWIPLPSISNYNLMNEYEMNPWDGFAELVTLISAITREEEVEVEDIYSSKLEEDLFLEGFSPISSNIKLQTEFRLYDDYRGDVVRIKKIIHFGSTFLCHCSPPILKRIANDGKEFFINIASASSDPTVDYNSGPEFKEIPLEKDNDEFNVALWDASFANDKDGLLAENPEVNLLIKRKQELEERRKMEETYQQNLHDILRQFGNILQIEVRPKSLVPDTNCFIDSLPELQIIANDFKHYVLAVPLVVVNELEGLSKGVKPSNLALLQVNRSKIHHFDEVSSSASKALQFIRSKNFAVKCVTTKGSFLNTSAFTVEEHYDDYQSNDDKILATAFNLGKMSTERSEGRNVVTTSVVLLTTDRNLRVKALSKNLPVSELQEFLRWAKMEI